MFITQVNLDFFCPNQRTTRVRGGDWCEMRGRAGLEKGGPFLKSRAVAHLAPVASRVVCWLGEKKGTALQSKVNLAN